MQDPLINAIQIAIECHHGQVDKAGLPYIDHCLRVLDQVRVRLPNDIEAQAAAVLHDVVEDCGLTDLELRKRGCSARTIDLVFGLTKSADRHLSYLDWIKRIGTRLDVALPIIKLADVRDNGAQMRLAMIKDAALRERLRYKYERAVLALVEALAAR